MMHRRDRNKKSLGVTSGDALRGRIALKQLSERLFVSSQAYVTSLRITTSAIAISCGAVGLWAQNPGAVPPPGVKSPARGIGQAPGLESFAVQPQKPEELIDAIDYLVRVGRDDQAVGLAQKLVDSQADTETLLRIRDRFGTGKLLTLQSTPNPRLRQLLNQFADSVAKAAFEGMRDESRIAKLIKQLGASKEETELAREGLSRAGSPVVSSLINAYLADDATPQSRRAIQQALNALQTSAVPGLVGALRHPDARARAAVAEALGEIRDHRALPWLVYQSTQAGEVGQAAGQAVMKLNHGRSVDSPLRFLTSEAASYLDRDVYFTSPNVETWVWNEKENELQSVTLDKNVAEGAIGYRLARLALNLDPNDAAAQAIALSTLLQEESDRLGAAFPKEDPAGVWAMALASGPRTLENVLKRALLTGRHEAVAVLAIKALGQVAGVNDLATGTGRPHVLVDALSSTDRRVQFEAAKTLVELDPSERFPGSSRVVPALARFIQANPQMPRAIVVNNNMVEGSNWISYLKNAGYDALLETSGRDGFMEAARRGDAELILVSTQMDPTGWDLPETVSNFKADARTAGVPLIVVGALDAKLRLRTLLSNNPGLGFMVSPANEAIARRQIDFQLAKLVVSPLTTVERVNYATQASALLSRLASEKGPNAMTAMLGSLDPHVYRSLKVRSGASTLAPVPTPDELGDLAGRVLQESLPAPERIKAAQKLAGLIQKSGVDAPAEQAQKIDELFLKLGQGGDKQLREGIAALVGVNKPDASTVADIFKKFAPLAEIYESIQKTEK